MTAIVDVHAHYYPPAYLDAVRKLVDLPGQVGDAARFTTAHPFIHRIPHFTGAFDERIALMNQAEIAVGPQFFRTKYLASRPTDPLRSRPYF